MSRKPRALVLAFRNDYLNSTDDVLYRVLADQFDLVFYGPGYVPLSGMLLDARAIYDKLGPFDACFVHQYVMHNLYSGPKFTAKPSHNQYFAFNGRYFAAHCADFAKNFNDIPCRKFLISLRTDCYAFTPKEEEEYAVFNGHLIVPPPEVIAPVSTHINLEQENFEIKATDRYIDFCKSQAQRIIPVAHLMANDEFMHVPLDRKKFNVAVPGAPYFERLNAYQALKEAGYNPAQQYDVVKYARYFMRATGWRFAATCMGVKFFKYTFRDLIAHSRVTFTDGSRVRAPIRKYFEIPAYSSLLAAERFYNTDALGFIPGQHFVECDAKTIADVVDQSLRDESWTRGIIAQSSSFIRQTHSEEAWKGHFRGIYTKIEDGTFAGARWHNGAIVY